MLPGAAGPVTRLGPPDHWDNISPTFAGHHQGKIFRFSRDRDGPDEPLEMHKYGTVL